MVQLSVSSQRYQVHPVVRFLYDLHSDIVGQVKQEIKK